MDNYLDDAVISVDFPYLSRMLTHESIRDESLTFTQHVEVKDVEYLPEEQILRFHCGVYEASIN